MAAAPPSIEVFRKFLREVKELVVIVFNSLRGCFLAEERADVQQFRRGGGTTQIIGDLLEDSPKVWGDL
jgi:hypothetical protein